MRWLLVGIVLGLTVLRVVPILGQSIPFALLNGRTTGGVNVPLLVNADGTLHIE